MLGAGAWGTALACHAARLGPTRLWARDATAIGAMGAARQNTRYLPGLALPDSLALTADLDAALDGASLAVLAVPMAALAATLARLPPTGPPAVILAKGLEAGSGRLGHEVAAAVRAGAPSVLLSGPSFAQEVAAGQPTALVAASADATAREAAAAALHGGSLRVYTSADATGVAVGGAVKNVLAIATGLADGMALGTNARAALVTRGLAEIARFGAALGAEPATFAGLSGLGDLVLTTTGALSRNRAVGLGLAAGRPLAEVLAALGHVAEGVSSAPTVHRRAEALGVEMPIVAAVVDVLEGRIGPRDALAGLLARAARSE